MTAPAPVVDLAAHRQTLAERKAEAVDLAAIDYPTFTAAEARAWAKACHETPMKWAKGWERALRARWCEFNRSPFPYSTGRVAKAILAHMEEK